MKNIGSKPLPRQKPSKKAAVKTQVGDATCKELFKINVDNIEIADILSYLGRVYRPMLSFKSCSLKSFDLGSSYFNSKIRNEIIIGGFKSSVVVKLLDFSECFCSFEPHPLDFRRCL